MIPDQDSADPNNPEEAIAWAMQYMPTFAGAGAITHPGVLRQWSKHLVECGFVHVSQVAKLADESGNVHVSRLPKQRIKLRKQVRGPRHQYNAAAVWAPFDSPEPPKTRIPNIADMTLEENQAMLDQYRRAGMITDRTVGPPIAGVVE